MARSAASRQEASWGEFTYAMTSRPTQVADLHMAAQDYGESEMEVWSNLTWADYRVLAASAMFFVNRDDAMKNLDSAKRIYEGLTDFADSDTISNRARLGLARVYEMQNDLDEARKTYETVGGTLSEIAKNRAEALGKADAGETFRWLATARATTPPPPPGPGTPGERPLFDTEFSPAPPGAPGTPDPAVVGDDLFDFTTPKTEDSTDRYTEPGTGTLTEGALETDAEESAAEPAEEETAEEEPAEETPAEETPAEPPSGDTTESPPADGDPAEDTTSDLP